LLIAVRTVKRDSLVSRVTGLGVTAAFAVRLAPKSNRSQSVFLQAERAELRKTSRVADDGCGKLKQRLTQSLRGSRVRVKRGGRQTDRVIGDIALQSCTPL
jgi:hypothetical protein